MDKCDVTIVRGGFASLLTALHYCSEVGALVLFIDKGEIGEPRKASPFTLNDVLERYKLNSTILQKHTCLSYESPKGISTRFQ